MHVYGGYPLYLPENIDRWHSYPPPAPGGFYVVPWLWIDGNQHGGSLPAQWENLIVSRLNQPAVLNVSLSGYYSPPNQSGVLRARFRNDSSFVISGFALFVITEDSIWYPAPNFDSVHNHVARDFLPDHIGTALTIPAGDSVVISQPFAVQAGWNLDRCRILAWLQDTVQGPDSTKNIYQGSMIDIADLAIEEDIAPDPSPAGIRVVPNPADGRIRLAFDLPRSVSYKISVFDIAGRQVCELDGTGTEGAESVDLDLRGRRNIRPGVYFYLLRSAPCSASGKFVLR
jgi:hypothetical protein